MDMSIAIIMIFLVAFVGGVKAGFSIKVYLDQRYDYERRDK